MKLFTTFAITCCLLILATGFSGCGTPEETEGPDSLLIKEIIVDHFFSSPDSADQFSLRLRGPSAADADLSFSIVRGNGDTIFIELLKGKDLLPKDYDDKGAEEKVRADIVEAMSVFVDAGKFQQPAAPGEDFPADNDIDIETYRLIKADPSAIGFFYKIRGPIQRKIAWSNKSREVIMYYSCCRENSSPDE